MARSSTAGAMYGLACAIVVFATGACLTRPQASDRMLRLIGAPDPGVVGPTAIGADCLSRYAAADSAVLSQNCEATDADTLRFSQVEGKGKILFEGRRIYVDAGRLRRLADSIEAAIQEVQGEALRCPVDSARDPYTERLRLWHVRGRTWFMRTTTIDAPRSYPSIEFESDVGRKSCADWFGPPMHRG